MANSSRLPWTAWTTIVPPLSLAVLAIAWGRAAGLPLSFVGVVIALLVLLPETLAAVGAALRQRLLALTVVVTVLTVLPGRATLVQAGVHLALLAAYLFLSISP